MRKRVAFITYIDMSILVGSGELFPDRLMQRYLTARLIPRMRAYNTAVCRAPSRIRSTDPNIGTFIIFVDLDYVPGEMYSKESAQNVLRNVILQDIPEFLLISLAPSEFQPEYSNEGNI